MEGRVKWFNTNKGYGFIEGDDGEDYFMHVSQLAEGYTPDEDDRVAFGVRQTTRGLQAQNVELEDR